MNDEEKKELPVTSQNKPKNVTGKRPFSIKRRIWQRVLIALIFSGGIIFANEMGWLDHIVHSFIKEKINWLDNQQVIKYLRQVIVDDKLTDTPQNCLVFVVNNDNGGDIVNMVVREQHNGICTNTRTDFPILFTFKVNRLNGNVQIDKGSPNHFYPLH